MSLNVPEGTGAVAAPPAPAPKKNVFQRIAGVLFAPAETFEEIARRPDILAPLILLIVIGFGTTILMIPRMDFDSMVRQQMEQSGRQMSDADMERATRMGAAFGKVMAYVSPVWTAIAYVVIAAVLLFVFRLMGGEGTFRQAFSATLYSFVPMAIYGIVMAIVVTARGSFDPTTAASLVKSNLSFLVDFSENRVLYALLSSIDLFSIWTVALLTFGFAALSRLTRAKSAVIVVSLWIFTIVVKLAFAALAASRMKA